MLCWYHYFWRGIARTSFMSTFWNYSILLWLFISCVSHRLHGYYYRYLWKWLLSCWTGLVLFQPTPSFLSQLLFDLTVGLWEGKSILCLFPLTNPIGFLRWCNRRVSELSSVTLSFYCSSCCHRLYYLLYCRFIMCLGVAVDIASYPCRQSCFGPSLLTSFCFNCDFKLLFLLSCHRTGVVNFNVLQLILYFI